MICKQPWGKKQSFSSCQAVLVWSGAQRLTGGSAFGGGEPSHLSAPRRVFLALHTRLRFYPSDGAAGASILVDIKGSCRLEHGSSSPHHKNVVGYVCNFVALW